MAAKATTMTGGEDPTQLTAVESFLRKGAANRLSDTSSACSLGELQTWIQIVERSTRDAAEAFQRARSIGLVPHTLSTAHTHFGFTSDRLEAHCKILRRRPKFAKLGKKVF